MGVGAANQIQSTRISGNSISTGQISSSNWGSSAGSLLDLNAGTIKLGGSSDPDFAVNEAGAMTASAGTIGGWNISSTSIYSTGLNSDFSSGTGIGLEGDSTPRIKIVGDGSDNYVQLMYATNNWGIVAYNGTSDPVFGLGNPLGEGNQIAGWTFDTEKLTGGALTLNKSGFISSSNWHISSSTTNDPTGFISSSDFQVSATGDVTASNAYFDGYAAARAMRVLPVIITPSNKTQFCSASVTEEGTTVTTIFLDGSGAGASAANTYPDRVSNHVILDLNAKETGGDVGAVVNIVPPNLPGGGSIPITLEISASHDVELCIEKNSEVAFAPMFGFTSATVLPTRGL